VASTVAAPGPSETFLFGPGMSGPLASGDSIALRGCDASFAPSGAQVRVDHNVIVIPRAGKGDPPLVTYEVGGAGASVFVRSAFPQGYPAYSGDDPAERTFDILKAGGGPIADGDAVSLRINSNRGRTFFFRVTGAQEGARVDGDGASQGAPGTVFIATFNEVQAGAGWRPATVQCQICAGVVGSVRDQTSHAPLAGALVEALDVLENHAFTGTTGSNGRFALADAEARTCIPSGPVRLRVTDDRHQTKVMGPLTLPTNGFVDVTIDLDCTNVSGVVVDQVDRPLGAVAVALVDATQRPILGEDGQPLVVTTGPDGSFVFKCVPHGTVFVWLNVDPTNPHPVVVPAEGVANLKIVAQVVCGAVVGNVKDATTMAPIAMATVAIIGQTLSAHTNTSGEFRISCVRPAGSVWLLVTAVGYVAGGGFGMAPLSGDSAPIDILLQPLQVATIAIRLDWGALPGDLDVHLTGPDGMGGRFHCLWGIPNPVPFVSLDHDVITGFGPETITVGPSVLGTFFPGIYRVWVHNFTAGLSPSTFDMSNAVVTILTMGAGGMNQIGRFQVANATGMQDLAIWYVCDLDVTAAGGVTVVPMQLLQPGNAGTVL
jgi:carboxypeptidase family protein